MLKKTQKPMYDSWTMTSLRPDETGLKMKILLGPQLSPNDKPFIKVSTKYGTKLNSTFFIVEFNNKGVVSSYPEKIGDIDEADILEVVDFIRRNYKVLLSIWNDEITAYDAVPLFSKTLS